MKQTANSTVTQTVGATRLNIVTTAPVRPVDASAEVLDIDKATLALLTERKQWSDKLNEATSEVKRIDKQLEQTGFPKYEGTARTVLLRLGKRIVGAVKVSFMQGWTVAPFWKNTKQLY